MEGEVNNGVAASEHSEAPLESVMEDTISKERATELIKREKEAAYRKAQREYQAQLEALKTNQTQAMGGMQQAPAPQLDMEDVYKQVRGKLEEDIRKAQYEQFVQEQVNSFYKKVDEAKPLSEDFKEMVGRFEPDKFKEVFYLANSVGDSTPAIIYELMKNPHKLTQLDYAAKHHPELAQMQLQMMASSIKENQTALENNVAAEPPLSRPKTSLAAGVNSDAMNLKDLKQASWLRG